ncbi:MAG TPA: 3-hydroxyanthranilate 3,4-dioxygenase [Chloroflexota bacterium]
MLPLVSKDLWHWIDENKESFQPPVGNKVIWEDSQFTAMIIRGPNARRDFHVDPSDEIFYMLRGDMVLEYIDAAGQHQNGVIREGEIFLVPASVPHAPHRPSDTWGLVIERKRRPDEVESLLWFCERCHAQLHEVTMHVANIETELRAAIQAFDASVELRTCAACGHVQPERAPTPEPVRA